MFDLKIGDMVWIDCDWYKGKATVNYIDHPSLYQHHLYPIQVELEEAYDKTGQKLLRVNLKEIQIEENSKTVESPYQLKIDEDGQFLLF